MPNSTTLKNRQGSILYPKTQASITYMSNGNSVEAEINDLRQYEHNDKGYFTTEAELLQEYPNNISNPESRAGWHVVVGETDTVWIWDVDNNQWSNSGNIVSAVTSVNGKVGDVTLRGQDINATATRDTTSVTKTVTGHLNDIYSELEDTVTTDTDQVITGAKTFTNVIGLLNEDAGQVDQIKHINNNFLITSGTGTNLLNIDEGLDTISAFNRQLAFEDEIEEIQGHYVSYDQQTGKTEAQKAQARANIGAGTSDIDTVKVNGVSQPIENGSVNITLPETTQSIPIIENASVWELEEGWYIFKKYVTLSQLYQIRHPSNSTENGELLGYVSTSYVNTSNNNRLTKNLLLFCAEIPNNSQVIPVNLKSIAVATIIEVSESSTFDLWENVKYDDFVTLGTGQTITGAKNFTGILNKGGKAVATEEYVDGKIPTDYMTTNTQQYIEGYKIFLGGVGIGDSSALKWRIATASDGSLYLMNGTGSLTYSNMFSFLPDGRIVEYNRSTGETKTFATLNEIPNLLAEYKSEILNSLYPIGTIYLTTSTNGVGSSSPASWLGGTWERIQDRFLIGAGGSYSLGATGGSATHTLTVNEMPSHTHDLVVHGYEASGGLGSGKRVTNGTMTKTTTATGGGQAHNNMPPYLAVYMWERTA